jgi:ubiquinone/menaquinone biosynthesis C-methylase UbiE
MGWYREHIVPRVTDRMMDNDEIRQIRDRVCAAAKGDVLELGYGSGLSLAHLPSAVTGVWVVEPSTVARRLAADRERASSVPVHDAGLDGERLELPDDRFDTVLSTFTLCSIPDPAAALREVRRVLRPGGRFLFAEHGLAPDADVARWQRRLEPVQKVTSGGCHLTRRIDQLVAASGLVLEALANSYAPKAPRPLGYLYEGAARKG